MAQLIAMSRHLGDPGLDYAILGAGNTSAQIDGDTFWVKASDAELRTIEASGFVQVRFKPVLDLLEQESLDDQAAKTALEAARVGAEAGARPSVETALHAIALQLEDVNFVGHTHPTAVKRACSSHRNAAILVLSPSTYCCA